MAVGMRSVKVKQRKLENRSDKRIEKILSGRPIPAVRGPGGELFIIDHHHFGLALCNAEFEKAYAKVIDDKSSLDPAMFWRRMESDGRLYPYDENGCRVAPEEMPTRLEELRHDPFRDLAWKVREEGGFHKSAIPYAEFQWANFFRERIKPALVRRNRDSAMGKALKLSRSRSAADLPGYIGKAA